MITFTRELADDTVLDDTWHRRVDEVLERQYAALERAILDPFPSPDHVAYNIPGVEPQPPKPGELTMSAIVRVLLPNGEVTTIEAKDVASAKSLAQQIAAQGIWVRTEKDQLTLYPYHTITRIAITSAELFR